MAKHYNSQSLVADSSPDQIADVSGIISHNFQQIANGSLILGTVLLFLNLFSAIQTQNLVLAALLFTLFVLVFVATFVRTVNQSLRICLLIISFMGSGIVSEVSQGLKANGIIYFFCAVVVAALLLPKKRWLWVIGASAAILMTLAGLIANEIITPAGILEELDPVLSWMSIITTMLFLTYLISSVAAGIYSDFITLISDVRNNEYELTNKDQTLANQVRTLEGQLDSRKFKMVAARQISREIARQSSMDFLLKESVELIRSQFGYYHTGIFLKDEKAEFAVFKAGTGEVGSEMLARKHQLRLRDEGIVGYVVAKGEVRIASDVDTDPVYFRNPLLSMTRSEIAVPLRIGDQVIGALDIQSQNPDEFDIEDADILQTIADTLASSIDKLGQIQTLKTRLSDLEEKSREFTGRVWQAHLKGARKKLNFRYFGSQAEATDERARFFKEATSSGKSMVAPLGPDEPGEKQKVLLAVPIKLRDQVLGVVNIKFDGANIPEELETLVKTASDRLALALENARLLEEIQERAEIEHMVADISDKVREASDIDSILKTTASELGKSLGVSEVRIQLKTATIE